MAGTQALGRAVNTFVISIIFIAVFVQGTNCPPGWTTYAYWGNMCNKEFDPVTFDEAKKLCEDQGWSLATHLENSDDMVMYTEGIVWVGMRDAGDGDGMKVLDGSDIPAADAWVDQTLPTAVAAGSNPMCAVLDDIIWGLNSVDCGQTHAPLCEREEGKCPDDWHPMAGDCVKIFKEMKSWTDANQACFDMDAEPFKFDSENHVEDFRYDYDYDDGARFWIGAKQPVGEQSQWFDGSLIEDDTLFIKVDLDKKAKTQKCGYIFKEHYASDVLNFTTDCDVHREFACFLKGNSKDPKPLTGPNPNACSDGFQAIDNTCYWMSDYDLTWTKARDECTKKGAELFIASTTQLEHDLEDLIGSDLFWIGMMRASSRDNFQWVDQSSFQGTVLDDSRDFNGMLQGRFPVGNCVMATKIMSIEFYAADCDYVARFICQKDQDSGAAPYQPTQPPVIPQGACGNGWEEWQGMGTCYSFLTTSSLRWDEAENMCIEKDGHLASINTIGEENYILDRLQHMPNDEFWIGAYKSYNEGYQYTDGSPFAYVNWRPGLPERNLDHQYTVWAKSTNEWNSRGRYNIAAAICEKKVNAIDDPHKYTTPRQQGDNKFYECEENWFGWENNCFIHSQMKKTWSEARDECLLHDAELVSIGGLAENNFVESLLHNDCSDIDDNCNDYKKDGRCQNDRLIMSDLCPQTCQFCDDGCVDTDSRWLCSYWKTDGDCIADYDYMMKNCRMTCGCGDYLPGHWIGLNQIHMANFYEWSDAEPMTFTTWDMYEPNNFPGKGEGCVNMDYHSGKWSDADCDKQSMGFVCKKPKSYQAQRITDRFHSGCQQGTIGYGDKCYWISKEKKNWEDAKQDCVSQKGQALVYIPEYHVNTFLSAELANYQVDKVWIGYHYENGQAKWYNGKPGPRSVYLSNRDMVEGDCAALTWNNVWNAITCTTELNYMCMAQRDGYTTMAPTNPPPTTEAIPCSGGWTGFRNKCFKVFSMETTWEWAQMDCVSYGGNLVTIHDQETNDLIYTTLKADQFESNHGMWIGLSQHTIGGGHIWVDNSALTWNHWGNNQPDDSVKTSKLNGVLSEHCIGMYREGKWYSFECNILKPYACETYRGALFMRHSTPFAAPVIKCNDDGWREYQGTCYYSSGDTVMDWRSARAECVSMGGDLVSIASDQENNFVQELAKESNQNAFWIGLYELYSITNYKWSDLTPYMHQNWNDGEPNDANGGEKCVAILADNGKWNDDHCSSMSGFICKKGKFGIPALDIPTKIHGKCPAGFKSEEHSNKCFFLSDDSSKTYWTKAHDACKAMYSHAELASIEGTIDQAFVTLLLEESNEESVWIGLNALANQRQWVWADNSNGKMDNWGPGLPASIYSRYTTERCVAIRRQIDDDKSVGDWEHFRCQTWKPYLCQALRVASQDTDDNPFEAQYGTSECKNKEAFYYHNRCYQFYETKKNWQEAKDFCNNNGGSLALIWDEFEGARLNYESYKDDAHGIFWIDAKYDKDSNGYVWGDKYGVTDAKWEQDEPNQPNYDSCVTYFDGYWYDEPCAEEKPFFCIDGNFDEFIPTTPDPSAPKCENPTHKRFHNKCYWVEPALTVSWWDANRRCGNQNMDLTSVHSNDELVFLNDLLESSRTDKKNAWIGLDKGVQDMFRWSDGSAYTNQFWARGEPNSISGLTKNEDCVEMMLDQGGKWNDVDCDVKLAFICSTDAILPTTPPKPTVVEDKPAPGSDAKATTVKYYPPVDIDDNPKPDQPSDDDDDDDDDNKPARQDDDDGGSRPRQDDDGDDDDGDSDDGRKDDDDDDFTPGNAGTSQKKKATSTKPKDGGLSGGPIAGIVIGVLLFIALVVVAVFVVQRRYPLWRQESILRGNNSSGKVAFDNALYKQEAESGGNERGALDFGNSAA